MASAAPLLLRKYIGDSRVTDKHGVRQYNEIEATSLVIMRPAINRARRWLRSLIAALGIVRPAMPVRLCHPADFTSRDL